MKVTTAMFLGSCCFALACSRPEVHLIPLGYKGEVAILPGYPGGEPAKRDGFFANLFAIPPSGILVTQDQPSSGWHTVRYYYVDKAGRRLPIHVEFSTVHDTPENRADQRPIVAGVTTGVETRIDLPCTIYVVKYYVGTKADLLSRSVDQANAQGRRVQELVRQKRICR